MCDTATANEAGSSVSDGFSRPLLHVSVLVSQLTDTLQVSRKCSDFGSETSSLLFGDE